MSQPGPPSEEASFRAPLQQRPEALLGVNERYELTCFVLLRLLGLVYCAAFASLVWQVLPLIGSQGITPAETYLERSLQMAGSPLRAALNEPSLFTSSRPPTARC